MSEQLKAMVWVYHLSGLKINIELPLDGTIISDEQIHGLNASVEKLLAHNFTVNLPGLQAGEYREMVGAIVRYNKKNNDGTLSPRIYFYSDKTNLVHKLVDTYLDTAEEIREFEQVSGLTLASVPAWQAKATPDRKEAADANVLITVGKPFQVVFKDNPEYKGDTSATKYLFVRYEPALALAERPTPAASPSNGSAASSASQERSGNSVLVNGQPVASVGDAIEQLFPVDELNAVTPDALYPKVSALFNARQHFDNWYEKYKDNLDRKTTEEAIQFTRAWRWNWDKDRAQEFAEDALDKFGAQTRDILDALSNANQKKVEKWRDWDGGTLQAAYGALLAWYAGYDLERLSQIENSGSFKFMEAAWANASHYCAVHQKGAA